MLGDPASIRRDEPGVRTVTISQRRGQQLLKLLNFPCIKTAIHVLESYLDDFQLALTTSSASGSNKYLRPTQQQQNLLQRYKRDLVPGLLRQGVALGMAIVHVPQSEDEVPTIVPWSSVRVQSVLNERKGYKRSYIIESALSGIDNSTPVQNVFVCDCFGDSAPDPITGEFRSKLVAIEGSVVTYVEHLQTALRSERIRSQPTAFLESEKAKPDSLSNETSYGFYADAETLERSAASTYEINQNHMQMLAEQNRTFQAYVDSSMHGVSNNNDDAERSELASTAMHGLAPLPSGMRLVRGAEARSPELLVDKLRYLDNSIMSTLGVPRSFAMHDQGGNHNAYHMLHCVIVRSTQSYAKQVAQALTFIFSMQRAGKVVRRKRKLDDVNIVTCKFIETSKATQEELSALYDREVIDWETYRRLVTAAVGISADSIAHTGTGNGAGKSDPWSHEDRRQLLTGASNTDADSQDTAEVKS
ncbi:MAG: hypothetical protein CMM87_06965 [Rickettsiales bacterium]|nr:hypothetical protein [Rickettsiales bacterium]|tara:strand:+ start:4693 stop:6114 length:1422 start_codon:yes stop_codon:yes gene_type:complete